MTVPTSLRAAVSVGRRIKERRSELAISQDDLAHLTQINVSNIGKIERGQGNPRLDSLVRIAVALEISVSNLTQYVTKNDVPHVENQLTVRQLKEARRQARDGKS
ncbi:MAG: helix-turn-helix domain-containing protein [Canibacter sp.]